ncbi:MAG: TIGR00282 family metallophosphoesterase [Oscillospiraceae bacterium]|nr:TIGR00282 family metallophosphoesterase [Oscillospiraceae bacterium]
MKTIKILCIGDIVSVPGRSAVRNLLPAITEEHRPDIVIANGENLSHGNGISRQHYREMCESGIDAFTLGNHAWGHKDAYNLLKYERNIIRPLNFDKRCAGSGSCVIDKNGISVGIINLIGRVYMPVPCDSPFNALEREVERLKKKTNIIIVDFHAEATSEKQALGWFADGKVSAVFGTHTHVQTADEFVMPKGTGYISDLGMTGAVYSVLGMDKNSIVERFLTGIHGRFELADGRYRLSGAVFEIDASDGKCTGITRINAMQLPH